MKDINEEVLKAWIRLTLTINKDRLVPDLTFNESVICRLLKESTKGFLTASELCESTGILKSQMNRILGNLEKKALIKKERSTEDKRDIFILPSDDKTFYDQHADILKIVSKITKRLGTKKSIEAIDILHEIAKIAKEEL